MASGRGRGSQQGVLPWLLGASTVGLAAFAMWQQTRLRDAEVEAGRGLAAQRRAAVAQEVIGELKEQLKDATTQRDALENVVAVLRTQLKDMQSARSSDEALLQKLSQGNSTLTRKNSELTELLAAKASEQQAVVTETTPAASTTSLISAMSSAMPVQDGSDGEVMDAAPVIVSQPAVPVGASNGNGNGNASSNGGGATPSGSRSGGSAKKRKKKKR